MRLWFYFAILGAAWSTIFMGQDYITVAILAKDKAHCLPLYLTCLEKQTWPKENTYLYIRTNNNTDNTVEILQEWLDAHGHKYADVYFDATDVPEPVQDYGHHEWNAMRFKVLGKIRKESIEWAREHNSHYFVADCDNFIKPQTISTLFKLNLPIVAPLLILPGLYYSNFHAAIDQNGYLAHSDFYHKIHDRTLQGIFIVPVVHCTYLIRQEYLAEMSYDDNSYRYEYVIFSANARSKGIDQYLDNREYYGLITFAKDQEELDAWGHGSTVTSW